MSEDELEQFEGRFVNGACGSEMANTHCFDDAMALVAEVRRLRAVVKSLEWGSCDGCGNRNRCTECGADRMGEWDERSGEMVNAGSHNAGCPVFTESGDVK